MLQLQCERKKKGVKSPVINNYNLLSLLEMMVSHRYNTKTILSSTTLTVLNINLLLRRESHLLSKGDLQGAQIYITSSLYSACVEKSEDNKVVSQTPRSLITIQYDTKSSQLVPY